jgi:hypothetical protein
MSFLLRYSYGFEFDFGEPEYLNSNYLNSNFTEFCNGIFFFSKKNRDMRFIPSEAAQWGFSCVAVSWTHCKYSLPWDHSA